MTTNADHRPLRGRTVLITTALAWPRRPATAIIGTRWAINQVAWVCRRSWKCSPRYSGHRWASSALARARFHTRWKLLRATVPAGPREPPGLVKMRS
jgi:hypothetical protein